MNSREQMLDKNEKQKLKIEYLMADEKVINQQLFDCYKSMLKDKSQL